MSKNPWIAKRERQNAHIKESLVIERGTTMGAGDLQTIGTEIPHVAAAEARAKGPALVSSIEAVARSRLLTVGIDALLAEVALLLSGSQITLVVVCDVSDAVVGVITETILDRQLGFGQADVFTTRAGEVMDREYTACSLTDSLPEVLAMMHNRGLIHVLVVDTGRKPLSVVNARDGLRALLAAGNYEEALLRNYVIGVGYQ
jgi:CBS domain-containing protein